MHHTLKSNSFLAGTKYARAISSTTPCRLRKIKTDTSNPKAVALNKIYRHELIAPHVKGYALLTNSKLNKGMAFTLKERFYLGIHGLIPPAFTTEKQQLYRVMQRIRDQPDNLSKYVQLSELQSYSQKLYYRVLCNNVKELMPIVYTPTVGLACQKFGAIYRHPKGIYITIHDNSISKIYHILSNWKERVVKVIVVTDGERILGLGDLGAQGMGIPVGKLSLYVALAGVRPEHCLPVLIDVGTNNKQLLEDPLYIGLRRNRVRGDEYDQLIDNFMKAVVKKFGRHTLIQFEDFAFANAFKLLDRYREQYCTFNDDIQGTAAVIVAGLLATTRVTKKKLCEQKFLFHGAGAAGLGIAELMVMQMIAEGATKEQACDNIYMIDIDGLVTKKRAQNMTERHRLYAKELPESKNLFEIVKTIKPNGIIGVSTQGGAFTAEIIKEMATINERPIIFPLSNPTQKAECTAEEAIKGTDGRVLFASGSPFDDVEYKGKLFKPGQGNNSYIFPGVGLAAVVWKAKKIPQMSFLIAARSCASMVTEKALNEYVRLYPRLQDIRELSVRIAIDVGEYFFNENLSAVHPKPEDLEMYIRHQLYDTSYDDLLSKEWEWPADDCKAGAVPVPEMEQSSMDDE
uniref:Malic enzyme n=1 Tax=Haemonchus contortus TaxID=6289 RepID=A0A7I4Y8R6_HAECO